MGVYLCCVDLAFLRKIQKDFREELNEWVNDSGESEFRLELDKKLIKTFSKEFDVELQNYDYIAFYR